MERYRSVGVATIAALMGTDRVSGDESRPMARTDDNHPLAAAATTRPGPGFMFEMGRDFSQIGRRCERAVVTAYWDLRVHGTADLPAFRACTTLYRIHHPEAPMREARRLVAEWIDHHLVRGDAGPTPGCDCSKETSSIAGRPGHEIYSARAE